MPSDKNPVFRKAVIPWYNSKTAYIIVIVLLLLVFLFAMVGISVSREDPAYTGYVWVPIISGHRFLVACLRVSQQQACDESFDPEPFGRELRVERLKTEGLSRVEASSQWPA
jgi:hypothetical protein